jgi:hypothetical protein
MPKKKKTVNVKPITNHDKIQIDIKKSIEDDKQINPTKIFDSYQKNNNKKKIKSKY